jgi:hypothetical protein
MAPLAGSTMHCGTRRPIAEPGDGDGGNALDQGYGLPAEAPWQALP